MLICMNKKTQANIRQFHSCTHSLLFSRVKYIDAYADTYLLRLYLNQISFCTDSFSGLMPKSYTPQRKISSLSFPWPSHKHADSYLLLQNESLEGDYLSRVRGHRIRDTFHLTSQQGSAQHFSQQC